MVSKKESITAIWVYHLWNKGTDMARWIHRPIAVEGKTWFYNEGNGFYIVSFITTVYLFTMGDKNQMSGKAIAAIAVSFLASSLPNIFPKKRSNKERNSLHWTSLRGGRLLDECQIINANT